MDTKMLRSISCPNTAGLRGSSDDGDVQLFKEEATDDAVYCIYLKKVRYHTTNDENKNLLRPPVSIGGVDERKARLQWRLEEQRVLKSGSLERVVEAVCNTRGELDTTYVNMLLATYRSFTTTNRFLNLVINRLTVNELSFSFHDSYNSNPFNTRRICIQYSSICESSFNESEKDTCRRSLRTLLWVWLDTYPDDFKEPPDYESLNSLYKFSTEASDEELGTRAAEKLRAFRREEDQKSSLFEPVHQQAIRLRQFIVEGARLVTIPPGHDRLVPPVEFLSVQPKLIAAQLTYIDAELFKRVVPHHCMGGMWASRTDKRCVVQPLTVYATVEQFNAVSYRVIATCLKYPTALPFERARVLEHWIAIAQECRILKNFSSLKAIIAGLQSASVYRLKKAWQNVSREKMNVFEELAEIFNEENNQSVLRDLLNKEGTAKFVSSDAAATGTLKGTFSRTLGQTLGFHRSHVSDVIEGTSTTMQGTIPYLGTFLTDLTMIDTAFKDSVGSQINMDKKRREFEVLTRIQMLQATASLYQIIPDPVFLNWFYRLRIYDDKESYELSHDIEKSTESSGGANLGHRKLASLGFFNPRRPSIHTSIENLRDLIDGSPVHNGSSHHDYDDDDDDDDDDNDSNADSRSLFEYIMSSKRFKNKPTTSLTSAKSLSDLPGQLSVATLLLDVASPPQHDDITDGSSNKHSGVPQGAHLGPDDLPYSRRNQKFSQDSSARNYDGLTLKQDGQPYVKDTRSISCAEQGNVTGLEGCRASQSSVRWADQGPGQSSTLGRNSKLPAGKGELNGSSLPKATSVLDFRDSETLPVKVFLRADENHHTNHYKSIMLSHNDHARNVLKNVLVKYGVDCKTEEFGIYQMLPNGSELALPARGNIFYAIKKDVPDIKFIVRRRRLSIAVADRIKLSAAKQQSLHFSKNAF